MNRDLHVIKEEDECPNHLLNSVIKTIKCAGEANVDKIYKKLRNNSTLQYSKLQVEKAVDAAVQKGIFDVKNNVYKLKNNFENNDIREWEPEGEIEQYSNQEQSGKESESQSESEVHVDSENDYQTCKKLPSFENLKCPHCGTLKSFRRNSKNEDKGKKTKGKIKKVRKKASDNHSTEFFKRKKNNQFEKDNLRSAVNRKNEKDPNDMSMKSSYSDIDFLEAFEEDSRRKEKSGLKRKCERPKKSSSSPPDNENEWSAFKSDSESEGNENIQKFQRKKKAWSTVTKFKKTKVSENDNAEVREHSASILVEDWLEHSNEPQGAIMQSNNLLQIEPMDFLVVKSPQPASYFM